MADTDQRDALAEILSRVKAIQDSGNGGKPPVIPLIDPTANVLSLVTAAVKRLDDLRDNDTKWQDKLDRQRERDEAKIERAEERAKAAEKDRLDALRAEDKANIALALSRGEVEAKTLVGQVDTTAKALAASGGRQQGTAAIWAAVATIAFLVIAAIGLYLALRG